MGLLRKPGYLWPALWGAVVVAMGAVLYAEYEFGKVQAGTGPRAPAKVAEARVLPAFALPPEAQAAPETVARPLFVPTRRPSPPAAVAAVPVMRKSQFVLTGVTVTPELSFAFLKEVATGKTQSVKKGGQVNGITVEAVEARRVVLKQGEETEELPLNIQVPARVAAAPAATGAVPPAPGATAVPGAAPGAAPRAVPGIDGTAVPPRPVPGAPPAAPGSLPGAAAAPAPAPAPGMQAPATGRRRPWINAQ